MFHAFLGEKLPDWKAAASIVRKIAENYKLPYYTLSPTYSVCSEHGYITGEQYTCPICGKATEVYSRITGYYRPVQNFNDGKAQEFKDRRVYDIQMSNKKHPGESIRNVEFAPEKPAEEPAREIEIEPIPVSEEPVTKAPEKKTGEVLLFATRTCPNCKMASMFLDRAGIKYEKVYADESPEMTEKYGVRQAPTLIIKDGDDFDKIVNVSNIRKFAEEQA